jgi:hypothetical protein
MTHFPRDNGLPIGLSALVPFERHITQHKPQKATELETIGTPRTLD